MTDIRFDSEMHVELMECNATDGQVVRAARVSTQGAESKAEDDAGLIGYLMRGRHGSCFEHSLFTFRVTAPIFVWREHMRHRVGFSYNEESGRYKELEGHFYIPPAHRPLVQVGKPGHYTFEAGSAEQAEEVSSMLGDSGYTVLAYYRYLLGRGIAREVARMVLPVNTYSTAYVTCNPRSLMHFLSLRVDWGDGAANRSHPQWEIEQVARQYHEHFVKAMPLTAAAFEKNGWSAP